MSMNELPSMSSINSLNKAAVSERACQAPLADNKDLVVYLQCNTCSGLLYNAYQTSHGCRICEPCVLKHVVPFEAEGKVVHCSGKTENCVDEKGRQIRVSTTVGDYLIAADPAARREVSRLNVKCPNKACCSRPMRLKDMDAHLEVCPEEKVVCENCKEPIRRRLMVAHQEVECPLRLVDCSHCHEEVTHKVMQEHHLDLKSAQCCAHFRGPCPYCDQPGPFTRDQLEKEHKLQCTGYPRACKFSVNGCNFYNSEKEVSAHEVDPVTTVMHLEQLSDKMEEMQKDFRNIPTRSIGAVGGGAGDAAAATSVPVSKKKMSSEDTNENVEELMQKNENLQRENAALNENMKKCQNNLENMYTKFKRMQSHAATRFEALLKLENMSEALGGISDISSTMVDIKDKVKKHEEKIRTFDAGGGSGTIGNRTALERQVQHLSVRLADAERRLKFENISFDGVLIWKIENVKQRRQEAERRQVTSIYSQPFYTSRYGYKMCARIYLNGDGTAENNHVSLFFVVMKGEYDDLLSWPFPCKVTLKALDVTVGGSAHKVDTFKPDPGSTSFMRPSNDMNIASGCPRFIPHSELNSNDSRFVSKEDSMYIKVTVDTNELPLPDTKS